MLSGEREDKQAGAALYENLLEGGSATNGPLDRIKTTSREQFQRKQLVRKLN